MIPKLCAAAFLYSVGSLVIGQVSDVAKPGVVNSAYALKDAGLVGVLALAVVVLYRKNEAREAEVKEFVKAQAEAFEKAAASQSEALGQVAQSLLKLEEANREQTEMYREHINALVAAATNR